MNTELWNNILAFDFDNPPTEYGFSTRLAHENYWTKQFTAAAILEYKKFMFLAASSDFMVSPSEIVDVVWHLHLIYTKSYHEFCKILGKNIQHIPSTHDPNEYEKFKKAKERTQLLYAKVFGEQPKVIWDFTSMHASLNLPKARLKVRTFLILGILSFGVLAVPFYHASTSIIRSIPNPHFSIGLVLLFGLLLLALEAFNRTKLRGILNTCDKDSFIHKLHPYELIYGLTHNISHVIHGVTNRLIENGSININNSQMLEIANPNGLSELEQLQVGTELKNIGPTSYKILLHRLLAKPVFTNISSSMDALKKYIYKSKKFGTLFYINFAALSLPMLIAISRFWTGILRGKPVAILILIMIVLAGISVYFLIRLSKLFLEKTLPKEYKNEPQLNERGNENWQWNYFLTGNAALLPNFMPMVKTSSESYGNGSNNLSCSSCSSCGSSCGGGCGGCGGCGD